MTVLLFTGALMMATALAHQPRLSWRVATAALALTLGALPVRRLIWMKGLSAVGHIEWHADGAWILTDGRGNRHRAVLSRASATFGPWLLLAWRKVADGQSFSALVDSAESEPTAFRALKGRLKLLPPGQGTAPGR